MPSESSESSDAMDYCSHRSCLLSLKNDHTIALPNEPRRDGVVNVVFSFTYLLAVHGCCSYEQLRAEHGSIPREDVEHAK